MEFSIADQKNRGKRAAGIGIIFGLIVIAYFLDVIDFSIVQVALPSIKDQFGISLSDSQWVLSAYAITLAGFLMLSGRIGDIYGQKKIFVAGLAIFTLGSFAGGISPTFTVLVIFRAVQGIGAAMSTVTALAILIELYPEGEKRNKALGIFVAILSAGFAAGSILGGVLTVYFGWRSVMFVNVPIGIVAVFLSLKYISDSRNPNAGKHLDLAGATAVTGGNMLLVYSLTNAGNLDFSLFGTILPFGLSILVLGLFLLIELRSKAPLMPLGFLKRGSVLTANVLGLLLASTVVGVSFIVTIYLQQILNFSALSAGLASLPAALIFFFVGGFGAMMLANKIGVRKILLFSSVLVALGSFLLTFISVDGNYYQVLPGLVLWALGASFAFPVLNIIAFVGIKPGEEGLASGMINTSFRIGFPLGLAGLLIVAGLASTLQGGSPSSLQSPSVVVLGFRYALAAAALIGLASLFMSLRIKEPPKGFSGSGHGI